MKLRALVQDITGATKHLAGTVVSDLPVVTNVLKPPKSVEIRSDDTGFFLLYLDESGKCFADTWHATLEDAKAQAHFEFKILEDDWKTTS